MWWESLRLGVLPFQDTRTYACAEPPWRNLWVCFINIMDFIIISEIEPLFRTR